jgi:AraC-like DNA-binding protein
LADRRDANAAEEALAVTFVPPARHLLRARDLADARYFGEVAVDDMASAAGLSRAHFSREFRRAFGESPHSYLLTRRLERAAALLRTTDRSVADICFSVGLQSVGTFTTSFTRLFGAAPTLYRDRYPPASDHALIPSCVLRAYGRPQRSTFQKTAPPRTASVAATVIRQRGDRDEQDRQRAAMGS